MHTIKLRESTLLVFYEASLPMRFFFDRNGELEAKEGRGGGGEAQYSGGEGGVEIFLPDVAWPASTRTLTAPVGLHARAEEEERERVHDG